jgi:hypothetical protein
LVSADLCSSCDSFVLFVLQNCPPSFFETKFVASSRKNTPSEKLLPIGSTGVLFFFHGARNAHTSKSRKRRPLLRHAAPVSYLSRKNKVNISLNPRFPQRIPPRFPSHPIRDVRRYFPGGCPQVRVNIS